MYLRLELRLATLQANCLLSSFLFKKDLWKLSYTLLPFSPCNNKYVCIANVAIIWNPTIQTSFLQLHINKSINQPGKNA
jgi:hypothetical protein